MAELVRQLAEHDHADEDEPDDQHREHDAAAFGGGVGKKRERYDHGATLPHVQAVRSTCALDRFVSGGGPRRPLQLGGVAKLA